MGRGYGKGLSGIMSRRLPASPGFSLKVEDSIRQDTSWSESITHPIRNGSQIFADHQGFRAHTFQRQDRQQFVIPVMHVRSHRRREATGNPKQSKERHDMIDPYRSSIAEIISEQFDKVPVPARAQTQWI